MNPLYTACVFLVWFFSTYYIVFILLVLLTKKEGLIEKRIHKGRKPMLSIIVPAYNEESKIAETIASLKKAAYKKLEFIIVNDGSKDATSTVVRQAIKGDSRFRFIDRKENRGKAASLNEGVMNARGTLVAGMDADSVIAPDTIDKTIPYFAEKDVAAVTVSVKVRNPKGLLHRVVDLEFIIGLSLFLKLFSFFNCVFVTPGPFSIYRKSIVQEIGMFDEENLTEDLEIAYRIHKAGYRIENCMEAEVETIIPPTFKEIYIQRRRWYSGALQTLYKHRDVPFNPKYGMFSLFVPFNYLLIFSGMLLFYCSSYLLLTNIWEYVWSLQYTGIHLIRDMQYIDFDVLRLGAISLVGYFAFAATFVILIIGLLATKQSFREKAKGIMGYPLLFFLYQIYWAGAVISTARGKKIKWR